jgi:thiol-disulfide isomerase/thioredoxin
MANIYEIVSLYIKPHSGKIVFFIVLGIFVWAAYYAYTKWSIPPSKTYAEVHQPIGNKDANIYFFFADWCPHCKNAKPIWSNFAEKYNGKVVNGSKLNCISVNCTEAELPETTQMISKFNITTYPTIKMLKDDNTYEFDAKITGKNLEEFVNVTLLQQ